MNQYKILCYNWPRNDTWFIPERCLDNAAAAVRPDSKPIEMTQSQRRWTRLPIKIVHDFVDSSWSISFFALVNLVEDRGGKA